jgi:hypothetical protein
MGGDSGNRIFVLYWRCPLIRVSVIKGSTIFSHARSKTFTKKLYARRTKGAHTTKLWPFQLNCTLADYGRGRRIGDASQTSFGDKLLQHSLERDQLEGNYLPQACEVLMGP